MKTTNIKKRYPSYLMPGILRAYIHQFDYYFNVDGKVYILSKLKMVGDEIEVTYSDLANIIEPGLPTIEWFKFPAMKNLEK